MSPTFTDVCSYGFPSTSIQILTEYSVKLIKNYILYFFIIFIPNSSSSSLNPDFLKPTPIHHLQVSLLFLSLPPLNSPPSYFFSSHLFSFPFSSHQTPGLFVPIFSSHHLGQLHLLLQEKLQNTKSPNSYLSTHKI